MAKVAVLNGHADPPEGAELPPIPLSQHDW